MDSDMIITIESSMDDPYPITSNHGLEVLDRGIIEYPHIDLVTNIFKVIDNSKFFLTIIKYGIQYNELVDLNVTAKHNNKPHKYYGIKNLIKYH